MKRNKCKQIERRWGSELCVVNNPDYCGKLLYLKRDAESSFHYHPKKKETFYCIQGQVDLRIGSKHFQLNPFSDPITIEPEEKHSFYGIADAVILEVSTYHDEKDVFEVTESRLLV